MSWLAWHVGIGFMWHMWVLFGYMVLAGECLSCSVLLNCYHHHEFYLHVENGSTLTEVRNVIWRIKLEQVPHLFFELILTHRGFSWQMTPPVIWVGLRPSPSWGYELSKEYHLLALQSDEALITDALRSCLDDGFGSQRILCFFWSNGLSHIRVILPLYLEHEMFMLHRMPAKSQDCAFYILLIDYLKSLGCSWRTKGTTRVCEPHVNVEVKWLP